MTDDEYVFNLESELRIALRKLKKTQIAINMMTQNWLALADHYDASPRKQGEAETLRNCAGELARTVNAVLAADEPAKE